MPRSTPPTPGPRRGPEISTMSPGAIQIEFQQGLARAQTLEEQLHKASKQQQETNAKHSSSNSSNSNMKQIRFSLCEVLSHLILLSPALAATERLPDRLWSSCFYDSCKSGTLTLAKRQREQQQQASAAGSNSKSTTTITPEWEASWKTFMEQSIGLYDYLVDAMQAKLADGYQGRVTNQQRDNGDDDYSVTSSQETIDEDDMDKENGSTSQTNAATTSTTGIVSCLTRLYIHLGDLHRYSNDYSKAQTCYTQSAMLAPGHGNAFNQLAVLTHQQSPHYLVALCYYFRALAATSDSFTPALGNLQRLYKDNKRVLNGLMQQEQEEQVELEQQANNSHDDDNSKLQILTKPASQAKSTLSKRFLTELVDLQCKISNSACTIDEDCVNRLVDLFTNLLQQAVIGEGLLIKIVCILAQGEHFAMSRQSAATNGSDNILPVAKSATLKLASALAERILMGLKKQVEQQMYVQKKAAPVSLSSVKLLLPLMLLTEYLYQAQRQPQRTVARHGGGEDTVHVKMAQTSEDFWSKTIDIINLLQELARMMDLNLEVAGKVKSSEFKQYQSLRGFGPFQGFLGKLNDGYISDGEAMDVLRLHDDATPAGASSQVSMLTANTARTQESATRSVQSVQSHRSNTSSSGATQLEDACAKVARCIQFGNELVKDVTSPAGQRVERSVLNGKLTWQTTTEEPVDDEMTDSEHNDVPAVIDREDGDNVRMDDDEIAAGDFIKEPPALVYKTDVNGGVPLLVPGALLQQQKQPTAPSVPALNEPHTRTDVIVDTKADSIEGRVSDKLALPMFAPVEPLPKATPPMPLGMSSPPLPPGMAPPPGFGSVSSPAVSMATRPLEMQQATTIAFPPTSQHQPMYLFESPLLFGSASNFETANPFAGAVNIPLSTAGVFDPPASDFMVDLFANGDGSAFLGSGLLNSILSDDSPIKTKNPFA
ncbi:hypothetical protein MPSEU_000052200 [Mayamaea pseudoterrestris]|nr:hypothetical protein MPSEU_000052200 [Mayamaea pseudoterrestris]